MLDRWENVLFRYHVDWCRGSAVPEVLISLLGRHGYHRNQRVDVRAGKVKTSNTRPPDDGHFPF